MTTMMPLGMAQRIRYYLRYFNLHKSWPNLTQPRKFSEKIFHRMMNPHPLFPQLADKVTARDYVKARVGAEFLVPVLLVTKDLTQAQFDALPDRFVMKSNHAAGQVKIVTDKSAVTFAELQEISRKWLAKRFYKRHGERQYEAIVPQILFEELLGDGKTRIDDYKLHTFIGADGKLSYAFFQHIAGRGVDPQVALLDANWQPLPFQRKGAKLGHPAPVDPVFLQKMVAAAETLCAPFGYMRVDFYVHDGHVYFGEMTLTPGAGKMKFTEDHVDAMLGDYWRWPEPTGDIR